ncbi:MAG TPA: hypothetical protein VK988_22680 [Acidimicrobiales bacterium]|nr:hypothetical protein [Acidimicrobiales bacterium]
MPAQQGFEEGRPPSSGTLRREGAGPWHYGAVKATKADGRWTVEVWPLAPRDVYPRLFNRGVITVDRLADEIAKRHCREMKAHRQPPPPERPEGFLRGPDGARWESTTGSVVAPSGAGAAEARRRRLSGTGTSASALARTLSWRDPDGRRGDAEVDGPGPLA